MFIKSDKSVFKSLINAKIKYDQSQSKKTK